MVPEPTPIPRPTRTFTARTPPPTNSWATSRRHSDHALHAGIMDVFDTGLLLQVLFVLLIIGVRVIGGMVFARRDKERSASAEGHSLSGPDEQPAEMQSSVR